MSCQANANSLVMPQGPTRDPVLVRLDQLQQQLATLVHTLEVVQQQQALVLRIITEEEDQQSSLDQPDYLEEEDFEH